jgi:DNA-binding beta-propeller fold protein YncE
VAQGTASSRLYRWSLRNSIENIDRALPYDQSMPPGIRLRGTNERLIRVIGLVSCLALGASGCGEDDSSSANSVPIRGGERLAWNQSVNSPREINAFTFRLYVDGAESTLSGIKCSGASSRSYDCSGTLPFMAPGPHVLELTAVLDGAESSRSQSLTVLLSATAPVTSVIAPSASDLTTPASLAGAAVCPDDAADGRCYHIEFVAGNLVAATALAPAPDGRLFFVEGSDRVRVIEGDQLLPDPMIVSQPTSRIVGLVVDSDFSSTRFVFVAWAQTGPGGHDVLNVTRYREVGGTLGEAATIVQGLPFPDEGAAPLAVDAAGLLYVAVPATQSGPGIVARFTRDGATPADNPRASPALGPGYTTPSGLAVDSAAGRVWLAGRDRQWLSALGLTTGSSAATSIRPNLLEAPTGRPTAPSQEQERGPSLAMGSTKWARDGRELLATQAGRLFTSALTNGQLSGFRELRLPRTVQAQKVGADGRGRLWVAVTTGQSNTATSIIRLGPR